MAEPDAVRSYLKLGGEVQERANGRARGCLQAATNLNKSSDFIEGARLFLGGMMNRFTCCLSALLLITSASPGNSTVRITHDPGGQIGKYVDRYQHLAAAGESVIIDGLCASACTIVLSEMPSARICVTSRAALGFHAAWKYGPDGRTFTDPEATLMLYSGYPRPVRRWIANHGGLKRHLILLRGKPLHTLYRSC